MSKKQSNPRPEDVGAVRPAPPPPPPKPQTKITEDDKDVLLKLYSEGPFLIIQLDPEIKEALAKRAKAEYRIPEQQAAYLIDKALEENGDDTCQSGPGRRGG